MGEFSAACMVVHIIAEMYTYTLHITKTNLLQTPLWCHVFGSILQYSNVLGDLSVIGEGWLTHTHAHIHVIPTYHVN